METVIIVSVLSTLGVVALLAAIAVIFYKLSKKVDVVSYNEYQRDLDNRFSSLEENMNQKEEALYREIEKERHNLSIGYDEIYKTIDSRCDKLYTQIQAVSETKGSKQILKS